MANALGLNVIPESVQEQNGFLHGICGFWQGKPVPFLLNPADMDIMTPESPGDRGSRCPLDARNRADALKTEKGGTAAVLPSCHIM